MLSDDVSSERIIDKKYVLLASSHHREEIIVIKEWLKLKSNKYLLVIAPRHPERLGDILSDIPLSGVNIAIRSKSEKIRSSTQIYIADTFGEMNNLINDENFDGIEEDLRKESERLQKKYKYNPDRDWWLRKQIKKRK